jgi:hypothetical protein
MSKVVFDKISGVFWTDNPSAVPSDDPRAIVLEAPKVAAWRLSYDPVTKNMVVKYPGMSDTEAEAEAEAALKAPSTPEPQPDE